LVWEEPPRNILIIKKPNDKKTDRALADIIKCGILKWGKEVEKTVRTKGKGCRN
ncbi:hypothetical protein EV182_004593, partial [Spiromyces aspiralis]